MAGSLQQNARALMVRASSPMLTLDRQQDEVARLRAQLQHSKKVNGDMRALLQNQALAIEQFQNRWQMAKAISRPTRRMRSKGPLQPEDSHKSPSPGGDPRMTPQEMIDLPITMHEVQDE